MKYQIRASYRTVCLLKIEADSEDQAWDIAHDADGGSFAPLTDLYDWSIDEVLEVKNV